jgi:hypothetical protein
MIATEVDRLTARLHEDPSFRFAFSRDPEGCLQEFDFSPQEKSLLRKQDQYALGAYNEGLLGASPCVCVIAVVVVNNNK